MLAPCAVARVVDDRTIPRFACRIVAGAANDTLAERADAERLAERGIVYVPDYVANAGGVVRIDAVRTPGGEEDLGERVLAIGDRVSELLAEAAAAGVTATTVAERRAARILEAARATKREAVAA